LYFINDNDKNRQIEFPKRYKTITVVLVYIKKYNSTLDFLPKETFNICWKKKSEQPVGSRQQQENALVLTLYR